MARKVGEDWAIQERGGRVPGSVKGLGEQEKRGQRLKSVGPSI